MAEYGYWKTLNDFIQDSEEKSIENNIINKLDPIIQGSEKNAWREALPKLHNLFEVLIKNNENIANNVYIGLEYLMPNASLKRCDIILVGQANIKNKLELIVIELKGWETWAFENNDNANDNYNKVKDDITNYIVAIKNSHSYHDYLIIDSILIPIKMSQTEIDTQKDKTRKFEIFSLLDESIPELSKYIGGKFLKDNISQENTKKISLFMSEQEKHRPDLVLDYFLGIPTLWSSITRVLCGVPRAVSFTSYYKDILKDILLRASSSEKSLTIISGQPGSGKTMLGIYAIICQLYHDILDGKLSSKYVIRNKAIRNNLEMAIKVALKDMGLPEDSFLDLVSFPMIFAKYKNENGYSLNYNLVIVDEAQNFPDKELEALFEAGKAIVWFTDTSQCIYKDTSTNIEKVKDIWKKINKNEVIEENLNEQYRLPEDYFEWLQKFFSGDVAEFPTHYDINIVNAVEDLINYVNEDKELRGVILIPRVQGHKQGIKVKIIDTDGKPSQKLYYLLENSQYSIVEDENMNFNNINTTTFMVNINKDNEKQESRCCVQGLTAYYAGGIDIDRVGLIWNDDLDFEVSDDGKIKFISPETSPKSITGDLKNHFKVIFSRAKKGIRIFFTNEKTKEKFKKLMEKR